MRTRGLTSPLSDSSKSADGHFAINAGKRRQASCPTDISYHFQLDLRHAVWQRWDGHVLPSTPTSSSLRITDRSFRYASPCLWNQLRSSLRQPHFSPSVSALPVHAPTTSSHSVNSALGSRPTSFTNLSHHRLPSSLRTDSTDFTTGPFLLSISVLCLF